MQIEDAAVALPLAPAALPVALQGSRRVAKRRSLLAAPALASRFWRKVLSMQALRSFMLVLLRMPLAGALGKLAAL